VENKWLGNAMLIWACQF